MLKSIGKISKELDIHIHTLRDMEKNGKITAYRTIGGHRRYNVDEVKKELFGCIPEKNGSRKTILYVRISKYENKEDLLKQKEQLELYAMARGYAFETIEDVGSSLDFERVGFNKLMQLVLEKKVGRIVVNWKNRLARLGFGLIEYICEKNGCDIEIVDNTKDSIDEREYTDDLLNTIKQLSLHRTVEFKEIKKILRKGGNV